MLGHAHTIHIPARSDRGKYEVLGFFFSEWAGAEAVVVTRGGLELCTFAARRQVGRGYESWACCCSFSMICLGPGVLDVCELKVTRWCWQVHVLACFVCCCAVWGLLLLA